MKIKSNLLLFFILFVALFIRLYDLNAEGLWTDELISMYTSNPFYSIKQMYNVLHFWDQTPPLYPILFWIWLKIVGFTALNGKIFSVIGGMLSLIIVYFLTKETYNKKTALIITFIVSITPYHVYYSREIRSYIWAFAIVTLVFYFFIKQLKNYNYKRNRVFFIISGSLLLYVSYFSFFIHMGLVTILFLILILKLKPIQIKNWIIDYVFIGISYIPWVYPFIKIFGFHNENNGTKPNILAFIKATALFSAVDSGNVFLIIAYFIVICLFAYQVYTKNNKERNTYFFLFFILFVFVYALMYLKSVNGRNILGEFMARYIIILYPAFIIILGGILYQLSKPFALAFTMLFVVANAIHYEQWKALSYNKIKSEPYREIASYVANSKYNNIPIICTGVYINDFYYYENKMNKQLIDPVSFEIKNFSPTYFWVTDSYDLKAQKIVDNINKQNNIEIIDHKQVNSTTGNTVFNAYLVHVLK